jgi:hypothetical protein
MPILQYTVNFPGQLVKPRIAHMLTNDTLAEVQVAGYIDPYIHSQGYDVEDTDFVFVAAIDGRLSGYYTQSGTVFTIVSLNSGLSDPFAIDIEHGG